MGASLFLSPIKKANSTLSQQQTEMFHKEEEQGGNGTQSASNIQLVK